MTNGLFRGAVWLMALAVYGEGCRALATEADLRVDLGRTNLGKIRTVAEAGGFLWVGSDAGLFRARFGSSYDRMLMEVVALDGISENPAVTCLCPDGDALWIGTQLRSIDGHEIKGGLYRWEPKSDKLHPITRIPVTALLVTDRILWIGTDTSPSIYYLRKGAADTTPLAIHDPVTDLAPDERGGGWAATSGGLYHVTSEPPNATRKFGTTYSSYRGIGGMWISAAATVGGLQRWPGQDMKSAIWNPNTQSSIKVQCNGQPAEQVNRFRESRNILWLAAQTDLLHWRAEWSDPLPTGLKTGKVRDLFLGNNSLWVAADSGLVRIAIPRSRGWEARVTVRPLSLSHDPRSKVTVEWDVNNYGGRATSETVRCRVTVRDLKGRVVGGTPTNWLVGQFSTQVGPIEETGRYTITVEAMDLWDEVARSDEQPLGVKGFDYYLWRSLPPLLLLGVLVVMLVFFPALSRVFLSAILGYRWRVEIHGAGHAVTLTPWVDNCFRVQYLGAASLVPKSEQIDVSSGWKREDPSLVKMRSQVFGDNVHVYVASEGFGYPWAQAVGSPWSSGDRAVIAGQLAEGKPTPGRPLGSKIRFAALGCITPRGTKEILEGTPLEVEKVTEVFRQKSATIIGEQSHWAAYATVADFKDALKTADIVHLSTHAEHDKIGLADGFFTVNDVIEIESELRCTLLVLSACVLASYQREGGALAYEFVKRGVNVIAATDEIDNVFGLNFFHHLYRELMPFRGWRGSTLGRAIQRAASEWERFLNFDDNRDLRVRLCRDPVDEYILFGNPSFRLVYTLKETDMSIQEIAPEWALSSSTSQSINKLVDWSHVVQLRANVLGVYQGPKKVASEDAELDDATRSRVRPAFNGVRQQFQKELGPLAKQVIVFNWILIPTSAVAMAVGAVLVAISALTVLKITGGVLTAGGFAALFGCVYKGRNLGKDQAFLQLLPIVYESQLLLARTKSQYDFVFDAFVHETMALRGRVAMPVRPTEPPPPDPPPPAIP